MDDNDQKRSENPTKTQSKDQPRYDNRSALEQQQPGGDQQQTKQCLVAPDQLIGGKGRRKGLVVGRSLESVVVQVVPEPVADVAGRPQAVQLVVEPIGEAGFLRVVDTDGQSHQHYVCDVHEPAAHVKPVVVGYALQVDKESYQPRQYLRHLFQIERGAVQRVKAIFVPHQRIDRLQRAEVFALLQILVQRALVAGAHHQTVVHPQEEQRAGEVAHRQLDHRTAKQYAEQIEHRRGHTAPVHKVAHGRPVQQLNGADHDHPGQQIERHQHPDGAAERAEQLLERGVLPPSRHSQHHPHRVYRVSAFTITSEKWLPTVSRTTSRLMPPLLSSGQHSRSPAASSRIVHRFMTICVALV
uniref:Uncharacterized protein n=1 Tax=Anopheles coluzzii TaxID=1518534 RepID=A0A8W7PRQ4_ANOCL